MEPRIGITPDDHRMTSSAKKRTASTLGA
jgi:hypothetical protein